MHTTPHCRTPQKTHKGFTLLIAVLVSGVVLSVGLAIFNILSKQVAISTTGRDSLFAFYAADTGIECAQYWDLQQDAFGLSSSQTELNCGGVANPIVRTNSADTAISEFSFYLSGGTSGQCVDVTVIRVESPDITTSIEANGYNTCDASNSRRLERGLRVRY